MVIHRQGVSEITPQFGLNDDGGKRPLATVVFVHGLGGHPQKTWETKKDSKEDPPQEIQDGPKDKKKRSFIKSIFGKKSSPADDKSQSDKSSDKSSDKCSEKNENDLVFWPRDLLPAELPQARILTYGYNADTYSGVFQPGNKNSILQHGDDLSVKLERSLRYTNGPIILLGHSLGGLVIKAAIQEWNSSLDAKYKDILKRVYAIVFCGTPHRGSDGADWGLIAANLVAVAFQVTNTRALTDLKVDSQILERIHKDFLRVLHASAPKIKVHSFREGRPLIGIKHLDGKVVKDFSAKIDYPSEVVEFIDADHIQMVKASSRNSEVFIEISAVLKGYLKEIEKVEVVDDSEDDSQAYQYLDRFHMADYEAGLTNVSARYENTCQWLLENDEFQIWAAETPSRIFWLSGYPGQGKSVLAKFVTQSSTKGEPGSELTLSLASKLRSEKPVVCYFFCSSDDDRTQSIRHLVGCLIHQMIIQYPNCAAPIEKTWRVIDVDVTESVESMWAVFFKALSAIKNRTLLLVIDAVDELEKKWWSLLLKQVNKAIKTAKTKVLVFITSRREPEIVRQLTPWQVRQFSLDNSRNTKDDILSFINGVVEQYAEENSFDETVAQKICSILKGRADGMFLWVTLAWSHFIDGVGFWNNETQKNRLAELERLPPGIDALYYRILTNVDPRLHLQLLDALRWIALAKRPLTLLDLSIALALKERPADSEELDRVISIEQFLRERCAHVIKIREGYITVTHQSFRDFLFEAKDVRTSNGTVTNQFYLDKSKDDCRVGLDCMTYLSLSDIPAPTDQMRQYHTVTNDPGTLRKFQFLEYSALYWFVHVAPQDDEFVEQIYSAFLKLIRSPPNFKAMCAGNKGGAYEIYNRPLFLAFRLGLDRIVEKLVKDGFNINEEDHDGNHIIHQTRRKDEIIMHPVGKLDTFTRVLESSDVNFLLGLGADINGRNDLEQTVLIRLVRSLHGDEAGIAEFKEWLQRLGVDINARDHVGATALHAAVVLSPKASDPVIAALIQRDDLDPNVQDNDGLTPLTRAIHWGKEHAARQLLKHPLVEVDKGLPFGESPLLNAASQYWEDVVRLILERLTTVDEYRDTTAKTILHWSVITGMRKCLALALDKQKATIDAPDSRGMTALHYAAQDGDLNAVLALLNRGAKVTAKNRFCETALHLAAQGGHTRVVQTLLQHVPGFLLDERDGMGCTVLHRAVVSGNDALVRFLVGRADVDLRKRDRHGRTPLAYAAAYGSLDTFKALMAGAPIFEGDGFGYSLLHFAMLGHNEPTIEFLLQPCGEAEAKYRSSLESLQRHCGKNSENRWGKTPLDYVPETSALVPGMRERGLRNSETHLRQEARLMFERRDTVETVYGEDLVMVVQTVDERAAAQEMLTT